RGPRAPVTAGRLPGWPCTRWRASHAKAMASTKSGSMPASAVLLTRRGASSVRRRPSKAVLCTPPPQTRTSTAFAACSTMAALALRAVSSSRVACTSAGGRPAAMPDRASHSRWKYSRPVLFGGASANVGLAALLQAPGIQERVGRPRVETAHLAVGVQHGDVGDAAQVQYYAALPGHSEHGGVERRHQRRALPTGSQVGAAEIGGHVDAAAFGDERGIANLHGERFIAQRLMAYGLAVRADRAYVLWIDPRLPQQGQGGVGEATANGMVQPAECVQVDVLRRLRDRGETGADAGIPRPGSAGPQVWPVPAEIDQGGIDAVHAGAGNQPEVKLAGVRHGGINRGGWSPSWCSPIACGWPAR